VWISGDDDFVRKLNRSDLGGTEILSWDTGTSYPYGCEFRIEGGNEYSYIVDARTRKKPIETKSFRLKKYKITGWVYRKNM